MVVEKVAEFEAFSAAHWDWSIVVPLTADLFKDSIKANAASRVPYADKYQRYNYVIQSADNATPKILVARWRSHDQKDDSRLLDFPRICDKATKEGLNSSASSYNSAIIPIGFMVNFFPEEPGLPTEALPLPAQPPNGARYSYDKACTTTIDAIGSKKLDAAVKARFSKEVLEKKRGVLDAHGKHFMLAQGANTTLGNFPKTTSKISEAQALDNRWVKGREVLYAGEIIVDIERCQYLINEGSGTYSPNEGPNLTFLLAVAELFKSVLHVPPAFVWSGPVVGVKPLRVYGLFEFKRGMGDGLVCGKGASAPRSSG